MSRLLARYLRMGQNWGQDKRVQQAGKSQYTSVPPLDGILKDHKMIEKLPV